jgi:threonyl-tRNA synthetase
MIVITLPDGSKREFAQPVSVAEVAAAIGPGLAKSALAGKIGSGEAARLVDLSHRIDTDAQLAIVTDKSADGLEVLRHSTAHLLAYAVKELFPDAQVTIGPVIENGFYYDFSYKRPFTPEDLTAIEARMTELAKKDEPVVRRVLPRDEAVAYFKSLGELYKAEIIASIPAGEDVSLYREGGFEDLCRGPHVPSTGRLKHFKLMKVAGAYWRGDHRNEMLQRIYGTAWASKDELQQYLRMLEEAEKRDHRGLAASSTCSTSTSTAPARCSGTPRAGRSGSRSSSTCARSTATTATTRSRARRSSTRRCGRRPATGTSTATTCSSPSRRSATTRSSR